MTLCQNKKYKSIESLFFTWIFLSLCIIHVQAFYHSPPTIRNTFRIKSSSFGNNKPRNAWGIKMNARVVEEDDRHDRKKFSTSKESNWNDLYGCSRRNGLLRSTGFIFSTMVTMVGGVGSRSTRCLAISPEEASSSYDGYASTYDNLDGGLAASSLGIDQARESLLRQYARGDNVLEIGVGTGLNLKSYDFTKIKNFTGVDISAGMLAESRRKATSGSIFPQNSNTKINFLLADATSELSQYFEESTFDTVVDTFSLCVMGNDGAKRCLEQIKHIVKPSKDGGKILLLENTKSSNPVLGWYQDLTAETAAKAGGKGCLYNQDVASLIRQAGLNIIQEESFAAGVFRGYICTKS